MKHATIAGTIRRIAILGNHLPRQCGIATFTTDLSGAIAAEFSNARLLRGRDERRRQTVCVSAAGPLRGGRERHRVVQVAQRIF